MGLKVKPAYRGGSREPLANALKGFPEISSDVLVVGDKGVGKTTFLINMADPFLSRLDDPNQGLYCSGVEIYAALFIRENERFLTKLAEAQIVVIDDVASLTEKEKGGDALALLIEERRGRGLKTVLAFDGSLVDAASALPSQVIDDCTTCEVPMLRSDELASFASSLLDGYRSGSSPEWEWDAAVAVAEAGGSLEGIDNAALYLMTASDFGKDETIDGSKARSVLNS